MQSFEEFHTFRKRQRAMQNLQSKDGHKTSTTAETLLLKNMNIKERESARTKLEYNGSQNNNDNEDNHISPIANSSSNTTFNEKEGHDAPGSFTISIKTVGHMMELYDVQFVTIVIIYLDLIASSLSTAIAFSSSSLSSSVCDQKQENLHSSFSDDVSFFSWQDAVALFLNSFTNFTLFYFTMELSILFIAFGWRSYVSHIGYVLDTIVILAFCVREALKFVGGNYDLHTLRLLSFVRFWRIIRYINTSIERIHESHNQTKQKLQEETKKYEKINMEKNQCEERLRLEIDAKKQIERMLKSYSEEMETLREALRIAAHDIVDKDSTLKKKSHKDSAEEKKKSRRKTALIDSDGDAFFDGEESNSAQVAL